MSNIIRIKRRSYDSPAGAGAPTSMVNAEIAFNEVDRTLYYGFGTWGGEAESILAIAGPGSFVTLNTDQTITGNKTFANNVIITGTTIFDDLSLNGGDISSNSAIFNLINEPYTINFGLSANTVTIGATSGITTIRNNVNVDGWFLVDGATTFTGLVTVANNEVIYGNVDINGNYIDASQNIFNAFNTPATIYFANSATSLILGATTGSTVIKNNLVVDADASINGGDLLTNQTVFNLLNTTATTINFAGAATSLNVGATLGTTTIKNNLVIDKTLSVTGNTIISGDLFVNSGEIDTTSDLTNLLDSPSSITFGKSATTINIGANTGITTIKNNVDVDGTFSVDGYASLLNGATLNNKRIENLADPLNPQDAATKAYVDAARAGLDPKESVKVVATANTALIGIYEIDGVTVVEDDRVLVVGQSEKEFNGIYLVRELDWERSYDANSSSTITSGLFTYVEDGTDWATSSWVLTTTGTIQVDVTELTFVQFASAGQTIAGNGLTKSGNTIDVVGTTDRISVTASSVDIASTYVGQTSINTLGTVTTGSWNADTISTLKGGTNITSYTKGDILYSSASNVLSKLPIGANTAFLQVSADGIIQWNLTIDGGYF